MKIIEIVILFLPQDELYLTVNQYILYWKLLDCLSVKMCHHEEQKNLWIHRYEAKFLPVKISDNVSDVVQFEVKHVKIHRSYMWKIKLMDMPLLVFLCNII